MFMNKMILRKKVKGFIVSQPNRKHTNGKIYADFIANYS